MINDGGPAFPGQSLNERGEPDEPHRSGMSLRDYFAAAALTGICAYHPGSTPDATAQAYEMADAMLAARNKEIA